jgi:Na+/melibiose symporter-like transporter
VLAGVAGVPLWLWLLAMAMGGVGFGMLLGLGENGWPLLVVSSLIAGNAQACGNSIGQALKADVIDLDELRTGALAFARFPLSEAEHTRIRRELDARAAAVKA